MRRRLASLDPRLLLAAILLVGAVLRLESITGHLSNDEGYSYLVGSAPSPGAFLHRLAAYENTPPLFYLLLTPLSLDHAAWLRAPAAIPGALIPLVLYLAVRRPLGVGTALLAAAIVAVAPYHVSYSDYSRGFMLEGLGCLLALWAILRLGEPGASPRWWLLYLAGGVLALYSEYFAGIFLVSLTVAAVAYRRGARLRTAALGLLPLASLLPWIGRIERGQDAIHHTKVFAAFPSPSLGTLRELSVRLVLGEHGAGSSTGVRWLEFLAVIVVMAAAVVLSARMIAADPRSVPSRAVLVIGATGALVLVGHASVAIVGTEIFNQRYLTVLIPLAAALIATALIRLPVPLRVAAAAALALAGLAVFVQRYHREYEPSLAPVRAAVAAEHPRTVLTNSAVVVYYLRALHPILDRPFGLSRGLERSCASPCAVVDDARVPGGVRPGPGPGPSRVIGFFTIRRAAH